MKEAETGSVHHPWRRIGREKIVLRSRPRMALPSNRAIAATAPLPRLTPAVSGARTSPPWGSPSLSWPRRARRGHTRVVSCVAQQVSMPLQVLQRLEWHSTPIALGDLFRLHKNRHEARAVILTHQLGWEVRLLIDSQSVARDSSMSLARSRRRRVARYVRRLRIRPWLATAEARRRTSGFTQE